LLQEGIVEAHGKLEGGTLSALVLDTLAILLVDNGLFAELPVVHPFGLSGLELIRLDVQSLISLL